MAKRAPVSVNGRTFPSKAALERHCRDIIEKYADGTFLIGGDELFMLRLVRERHCDPEAKLLSGKLDQIVGVKVFHESAGDRLHWGKKSGGNHLVIVYQDGTEIDFSWLKCCRGFDAAAEASAAMRKAIADQVLWFKAGKFVGCDTVACEVSGEPVGRDDCDVDHHPRLFSELRDQFCRSRGIELKDIAVGPDGRGGSSLSDGELAYDWMRFHARNARFRIVKSSINRVCWRESRTGGEK